MSDKTDYSIFGYSHYESILRKIDKHDIEANLKLNFPNKVASNMPVELVVEFLIIAIIERISVFEINLDKLINIWKECFPIIENKFSPFRKKEITEEEIKGIREILFNDTHTAQINQFAEYLRLQIMLAPYRPETFGVRQQIAEHDVEFSDERRFMYQCFVDDLTAWR